MTYDPITEEIRAIRRELAAKFGNDLRAITEDLRRQEATSGRKYIQLPRRRSVEAETSTIVSKDANGPCGGADR
jgi:hypothetical protein